MKSIMLPVTLFCYLFMNAQGDKKEMKSEERFQTVKMLKYPNVDRLETTVSISDIQVIPVVCDSMRLGYSTKGMMGGVITLTPDKPLTAFLQDHLQKMYKREYKKNGSRILFVIKELRVGDRQSVDLYAYTRFDADAYISDNGEQYRKLYTLDTVFVAALGVDVSGGHAETIEKALKFLLKRSLQNAEISQLEKPEELTIEQITAGVNKRYNIPILTDQVFKDGAYKNFEEFVNNSPSLIDYETVIDKKGRATILNTAKETLTIWGVCKQGEISKYYDGALIAIERSGNRFIISDYVSKTNRMKANQAKNALIGAGIGGVLGGFYYFSAMSDAEIPLLVNSYSYINQPEKQPVATAIDMKTGYFTF